MLIDEAGLTTLTLPRLDTGSMTTILDFGADIGWTSIKSWNLIFVLRVVVGEIVVGRVTVAVII